MATVTKRSERAIQIARLEGWEFVQNSPLPNESAGQMFKTINHKLKRIGYGSIVSRYSSYNGLMPIIEHINSRFNNPNTGNRGIQIRLNYVLYIHDPEDDTGTEIAFAYRAKLPDKELIDALQQAIILALTKETT